MPVHGNKPTKGRGAVANAPGRFAERVVAPVDDGWPGDSAELTPPRRTQVEEERARRILSRNDSPDVPFTQSINPYRGCEHGMVPW